MFWGRRKTHRLSESRRQCFLENNHLLVDKEGLESLVCQHEHVIVDIGCGRGELTVALAQLHPESLILACDLFFDGLTFLVQEVVRHSLQNVRLVQHDVTELLEAFPAASIDRVFIWFPDPWPKNAHHKRRLLRQPSVLPHVYRILKCKGDVTWRTDHENYFQDGTSCFEKMFQTTVTEVPDCVTSYHAKALKACSKIQTQGYIKRKNF